MTASSKTRIYDPQDGGAPFRCGVGLIILNQQAECLAFERRLQRGEWQWPQGGIDEGEDELTAAYRELYEETSLAAHDVEFLHRLPEPTFYLFPDYIARRPSPEGIKYRGQRHDWFVFLFKGDESTLRYDLTHEHEFCAHRWTALPKMVDDIVDFKKEAYAAVIKQLQPQLAQWQIAWQAAWQPR